ncbi:hypothetical protein QCA50_006751 [Cerrena zonata]|uniref:Uncharacterized protein n=1 Tax=Cerrena zonata TaxID=2478898 RepID=A0AAW0GE85_9APHY
MPFWRKHSPDAPSSPGAGPSSQVLPPPPLLVPTTPAPGIHVLPPPQTQPRTIKLTPGALLTLPYRLLHPPPAKSQLATWSITPQFDIKLEDILNRKHLPPLGLKDFEEWLLFVEHTPEYLYFILWLREYTARYSAWKQQVKQQQQTPHYNHSPLETSTVHQTKEDVSGSLAETQKRPAVILTSWPPSPCPSADFPCALRCVNVK